MVPLNKVKVLLGHIIEGSLECKVVLDVPDAKQIVHAASDEPLAARVELAELNCLCVARQLAQLLSSEKLSQCWLLLFSLLVLLLLFFSCSPIRLRLSLLTCLTLGNLLLLVRHKAPNVGLVRAIA